MYILKQLFNEKIEALYTWMRFSAEHGWISIIHADIGVCLWTGIVEFHSHVPLCRNHLLAMFSPPITLLDHIDLLTPSLPPPSHSSLFTPSPSPSGCPSLLPIAEDDTVRKWWWFLMHFGSTPLDPLRLWMLACSCKTLLLGLQNALSGPRSLFTSGMRSSEGLIVGAWINWSNISNLSQSGARWSPYMERNDKEFR